MIIEGFIKGSVIPGLIAGILLLGISFLPMIFRRWMISICLPLGFVVGAVNISGVPPFPPAGSNQALFYIALATIVWPWVERLGMKLFLRVLAVAGTTLLVLKPLFISNLDFSHGLMILGSMTILGFALWNLIEKDTQSSTFALLPLTLVMQGTALSILFLANGSALLSQWTGTFCAVVSAVMILGFLSTRFRVSESYVTFSALVFFSLILNALYFLDVSQLLLFLVIVPLGTLYVIQKLNDSRLRWILQLVVTAVCLGFVLYPAIQSLMNGGGY